MSIRSFLLTVFIFLSMHGELTMAREVSAEKVKLNREGTSLKGFKANGETIAERRHGGAAPRKAVEEENGESIGKDEVHGEKGLSSTSSVVMQIKSPGMQKKSHGKNIGFEYDYSRPKMHPPSHN